MARARTCTQQVKSTQMCTQRTSSSIQTILRASLARTSGRLRRCVAALATISELHSQLTWMQSSEDEENEARHQARQKRLQGLQKGLLGVNKAKDMLLKFKTKSSGAPSKAAESKAAKGQKSR